MAIQTQRSQLYFLNPLADNCEPIEVGCVTTIDGIDSTIEQIETTCLSASSREYISGLATPGTATFTINADPDTPSHVLLHQLKTRGETIKWALGWSDYDIPSGDPDSPANLAAREPVTTGTAPDCEWDLTQSAPRRSWITFEGFMNSFPFSFQQNSVVTSSIGIQVSGDPVWTPKAAAQTPPAGGGGGGQGGGSSAQYL